MIQIPQYQAGTSVASLLDALAVAVPELQKLVRPLQDVRWPLVVQGECALSVKLPDGFECYLCTIDATGQTDYTDERYWVIPIRCTNSTGDSIAQMTMAELAST